LTIRDSFPRSIANTLVKKQEPNYTVENVVAPRPVYDNKKVRVLATRGR